ncbi:MAG: nucleotide exchange factor GrpE, partial [Patescibacteria group bacterium]|nr:nucleotide exchange factor GrpE [Patescibacteria group bacterium]
LEFLPVYDNLKTAFAHADDSAVQNGWLEGIKFVVKQFKDALANLGVEEINTVGEKFDHNRMEAVSEEETDDKNQDGTVAKEMKAGYELNGKVIMAARVTVFRFKI